jgi:membrane carboxypeptidase/penicillin-binding protein PbpC
MKVADIAQIYQTIFNNGVFIPLTLARNNDTVISNRIWDENHVRVVKSALRQTIESNGGTLHRYKNDLPAGRTFYGKTGTSSRQKNFWTVLSDGKIVIVSWASYGKQNQGRMDFGTEKSWGASAAGLFAVLVYNELMKIH